MNKPPTAEPILQCYGSGKSHHAVARRQVQVRGVMSVEMKDRSLENHFGESDGREAVRRCVGPESMLTRAKAYSFRGI